MKKQILILLILTLSIVACSKNSEKATPEFSIVGREYAARWIIDANNRQQYIHFVFTSPSEVTLSTSIQNAAKYGEEKLTYKKIGDSYVVNGTIKQDYYLPSGTNVDFTITPTKEPSYEGSTIKSTFDLFGLNFIDISQ